MQTQFFCWYHGDKGSLLVGLYRVERFVLRGQTDSWSFDRHLNRAQQGRKAWGPTGTYTWSGMRYEEG